MLCSFLKLACDSNSTPIPAQTEPRVCDNELHDDEDSNGVMLAPRWPPRSPHASPRLEAGLFIAATAALLWLVTISAPPPKADYRKVAPVDEAKLEEKPVLALRIWKTAKLSFLNLSLQ